MKFFKRRASSTSISKASRDQFSVQKYLSRIEQAALDIAGSKTPIDQTITLWWGLDGIQLSENGSIKWITRRKKAETICSHNVSQMCALYPSTYAQSASQMCALQPFSPPNLDLLALALCAVPKPGLVQSVPVYSQQCGNAISWPSAAENLCNCCMRY